MRIWIVRLIALAALALPGAGGFAQTDAPEDRAQADCPRNEYGAIVTHRISDRKLDWLIRDHTWDDPADLSCLHLRRIDLSRIQLLGANVRGANLSVATLTDANLLSATLTGANLLGATLTDAKLAGATLTGANLRGATLTDADLAGATLTDAYLFGATLTDAYLAGATLTGANLSLATLTDADLFRATLTGAKLANATVTSALWEPRGKPSGDDLYDLVGVETLWFCGQRNGPLTRLRDQFRETGLRHHEREATFALERTRTRYLMRDLNETYRQECWKSDAPAPKFGDTVEGWFHYVFLELPIGYGLHTGTPWKAIGFLMWIAMAIYAAAIAFPSAAGGIVRVWPTDRLMAGTDADWSLAGESRVEPVHHTGWKAFGFGLYFSLLSAFHFGWRDFNVSNWLTKVQPSEFALRAHGWVRVVSGLQALASLYFLVMWVLFYFGRPLQ